MDKVAFLPFGLLVDKWRWKVFSGEITPANYKQGWNDLRLQYQGIVPPVARTEADFDPGAKYHVPASTPYTRYFLARILQFQFYKAACDQAGWKGPLHRCSFYGNKEVGRRLNAMLADGRVASPGPTRSRRSPARREMSGDAMVEYFRPLQAGSRSRIEGGSAAGRPDRRGAGRVDPDRGLGAAGSGSIAPPRARGGAASGRGPGKPRLGAGRHAHDGRHRDHRPNRAGSDQRQQ